MRIFDNTITKNLTTATAATSDGLPAPAGLSTSQISTQLAAAYTARFHTPAPAFSNPQLYGNLFNDNRAGTFTGVAPAYVSGLGLNPVGANTDIQVWDLGISDGINGPMRPKYSIVTNATGNTGAVMDATNIVSATPDFDPTGTDPAYAPVVVLLPFAGNINFISSLIVTQDTGTELHGNFHLQTGSVAKNAGNVAALNSALTGMSAADANTGRRDIDGDPRGGMGLPSTPASSGSRPDIGMDEYR